MTYKLLTYPWKCISTQKNDVYERGAICYIIKIMNKFNKYLIILSNPEFSCIDFFNPNGMSRSSGREISNAFLVKEEDFNKEWYEITEPAFKTQGAISDWIRDFNNKNKDNNINLK